MPRSLRPSLPLLVLLALLVLCIAVYWTGLSGGFVFDDGPNLFYIGRWLAGEMRLFDAIFWNLSSSPLDKRALAMASFALSAWIAGGLDPFTFKLHNLLLHCLTGAAIYGLSRQMFSRDPASGPKYTMAALAVAGIWLLHPLHVSTVLYSVQRMAQLAALCCILGMWLYMFGRRKLLEGKTVPSAACLLLGIPLLTGLAIQGKQNGAILPLLCLVLELAYFRQAVRSWVVHVFVGAFCVAPLLGIAAILALRPSMLLGGYAEYDFTVVERLMSQGRALMEYAGQFLVPHTPSMGLATDGFVTSHGLLDPPSTLASLLALVALSAVAIGVRGRMPTAFAGWFIFLVGHAVESSFLPLELYYEHRNLLPSFGLTLVLVDMATATGRWFASKGLRTGRIGVAVAVAVTLALGVMTHGRARVWSDPLVLFRSELDAHPESYRAIVNYVATASDLGDVKQAYAVTRERREHAQSRNLRGRMYLLHAWLDCLHDKEGAKPEELHRGIGLLPARIEVGTFLLFDQLSKIAESKGCGALNTLELARAYKATADHASQQPDSFIYKAAFRTNAAIRYAAVGRWSEATAQARLGWQPSTPPLAAAVLVEIMLVDGDVKTAQHMLDGARTRRDPSGVAKRKLEHVQRLLQREKQDPGWNKARVEGRLEPTSQAAGQPTQSG